MRAGEHSATVAEPEPGQEFPSGEMQVLGGRVVVEGLVGSAELNGQTGSVLSWNKDGKRRFAGAQRRPDPRPPACPSPSGKRPHLFSLTGIEPPPRQCASRARISC